MARDDGFAFRHALLQEVVYDELLPGERARLHAAFAAALEARPELAGGTAATVAAEIAHHWLCAGDEPRALAAAVRAGTEAERVGALAEAARQHKRALELWNAVPDAERAAGIDRATLLVRAANAPAWIGDPAEAIRLVDAAIALVEPAAEPVRAALLHQRRGLYLWLIGRGPAGVRDFERAVELIPAEPPSAERARALGGLGLMLMLAGRPARSREHCEAAVEVASHGRRARRGGGRPGDARIRPLRPWGAPGRARVRAARAVNRATDGRRRDPLAHDGSALGRAPARRSARGGRRGRARGRARVATRGTRHARGLLRAQRERSRLRARALGARRPAEPRRAGPRAHRRDPRLRPPHGGHARMRARGPRRRRSSPGRPARRPRPGSRSRPTTTSSRTRPSWPCGKGTRRSPRAWRATACTVTAQDALRCALGDLARPASRGRSRRASASTPRRARRSRRLRARARVPRDGPRPRRRRRPPRPDGRDRGRAHARRGPQRSGGLGRGGARLGRTLRAVPRRLCSLAPSRGGAPASRSRAGRAGAPDRPHHRGEPRRGTLALRARGAGAPRPASS